MADKKSKQKAASSSSPYTTRSQETIDELKSLKAIVEQLVIENKELKEKVADSLKSNEFMNDKFEEYKKTNEEVLTKLKELTKQNNEIIEKNKFLEDEIKNEREERINLEERLYAVLNPIEVEKRAKNLELVGEPETENENCYEKVKEILATITPKTLGIVSCYRTGYKFNKEGERVTRRIFIQFQSKDQRDIAFASRDNLKKITEKTLYLNEDLPPNLRTLRGKANAFKKKNGFTDLWIRNGIVLLRKNQESKVYSIRKPSDLEKIITN